MSGVRKPHPDLVSAVNRVICEEFFDSADVAADVASAVAEWLTSPKTIERVAATNLSGIAVDWVVDGERNLIAKDLGAAVWDGC